MAMPPAENFVFAPTDDGGVRLELTLSRADLDRLSNVACNNIAVSVGLIGRALSELSRARLSSREGGGA
jgi:hypothetical protein